MSEILLDQKEIKIAIITYLEDRRGMWNIKEWIESITDNSNLEINQIKVVYDIEKAKAKK